MLQTSWFDILRAARRLSGADLKPFTSRDLAIEAKLKDTKPSVIRRGSRAGQMGEGSTAHQIAGAWLSKFAKWGYAKVVGTGLGRSRIYRLTTEGMISKKRLGLRGRFLRLLDAVKAYRDCVGQASEGEAWKDLIKTLAEVEGKDEELKA